MIETVTNFFGGIIPMIGWCGAVPWWRICKPKKVVKKIVSPIRKP